MRTVVRSAIASAALLLASASAHAATIKLAIWNLNNPHHVLGEPLRPLPSWLRALNNGLHGIDQAGRDSRRQQPAKEVYQIGLV